jgi:hypothetical protein
VTINWFIVFKVVPVLAGNTSPLTCHKEPALGLSSFWWAQSARYETLILYDFRNLVIVDSARLGLTAKAWRALLS